MTDYLQLSDLAFQRHILVQALILIDFLLTLTDKAKNKSFYQNAQKAMQYGFTLREEEVSPCHPSLPLPATAFCLCHHDHHPFG
jgi:THO complex subunit 1